MFCEIKDSLSETALLSSVILYSKENFSFNINQSYECLLYIVVVITSSLIHFVSNFYFYEVNKLDVYK